MRGMSIAISVVLAWVLVPAAQAAKVAPPGNSGVNQYSETLPGAGGDEPTSGASKDQSRKNAVSGSSLSPVAEQTLKAQGPDGKAAAGLASATAPPRQRHVGKAGASSSSSGSGGSALSDAADQVVGGDAGGMGIALPIILIFSLLAALVFALRHRSGQEAQ